jgi:hypothetical protein
MMQITKMNKRCSESANRYVSYVIVIYVVFCNTNAFACFIFLGPRN